MPFVRILAHSHVRILAHPLVRIIAHPLVRILANALCEDTCTFPCDDTCTSPCEDTWTFPCEDTCTFPCEDTYTSHCEDTCTTRGVHTQVAQEAYKATRLAEKTAFVDPNVDGDKEVEAEVLGIFILISKLEVDLGSWSFGPHLKIDYCGICGIKPLFKCVI